MPVKKHFINRAVQQVQIEEFLGGMLENAGYAGVELQKTPMGTRLTIKTARPGIVIGRRGLQVKKLTDAVKEKFNINVPTIDVDTVQDPELSAAIQAEKISFAIVKGQNYRRAVYSIIRRIIKSGARGVEVSVAGKVTSQRARKQVFRAGIISKCGTPAIEGVDKGIAHCLLKSGIMGIQVKIMPESFKMPDEVLIRDTPKEKKKVAPQVDAFYKEEPEVDEIEAIEETEELFDDTTAASETVLKGDEETLAAVETIDKLTDEEKPSAAEEPEKEKKKATKKSTRKKSSKKKEAEEPESGDEA